MTTDLNPKDGAIIAYWDEGENRYEFQLALPKETTFDDGNLPDEFIILTAMFLKLHRDEAFAEELYNYLMDQMDIIEARVDEEARKAVET